ncbi:hypothetical protein X943_002376 [Babesia divergens]|uniref:Rab5-interacting protein n=1 Tax=Babesia divergens TaxID=32595 RepID=A0AAD9LE55_BABDI|nr:hypothetical protein X943_002376 [Babesia divergens]
MRRLRQVEWTTKLWLLRFFVSALCGLVLGYIPIRGIVGFGLFVLVQCLAGQLFLRWSSVPDYIIDQKDVFTEHLMMTATSFVIIWILSYSFFNF